MTDTMDVNDIFLAAIHEDAPSGDITTELLPGDSLPVSARVIAKAPGIFYGTPIVHAMCQHFPSLSVDIPIVGVPKQGETWNVSWLGNQAGWLEGSAFPSWNGNSVLTSHVYTANGLPGPFVNLNKLRFGDQVIVQAFGQKYIFEVRTNTIVSPNDRSVMKHEERPWLTLITCKNYDEETDTYKHRVVVRAVLVKVIAAGR